MSLTVGQKVKINLNPDEQIKSSKEVWSYQGYVAPISRHKIIKYGTGMASRDAYYEIEGVKSEMGLPFAFREDQLIPIYD